MELLAPAQVTRGQPFQVVLVNLGLSSVAYEDCAPGARDANGKLLRLAEQLPNEICPLRMAHLAPGCMASMDAIAPPTMAAGPYWVLVAVGYERQFVEAPLVVK